MKKRDDITRSWIARFEQAEQDILTQECTDEFDQILLDAVRGQLATLRTELEDDSEYIDETKTQTD